MVAPQRNSITERLPVQHFAGYRAPEADEDDARQGRWERSARECLRACGTIALRVP